VYAKPIGVARLEQQRWPGDPMGSAVSVLGIHASPRKYGETYKLLRVALEAAREEGAKVSLIHLYDYRIQPCLGCVSDSTRACRFPCVVDDDDFNPIGEVMLRHDAYIIATPVYWYGVSGVLKNFLDRLTSMENMIYHTGRSLLEGKVAGFIAVGNDTGAILAIAWLMVTLNSMGVHVPAWALAYHESREPVEANEAALLDAANLGRVVVKAAKLLKAEGAWYEPRLRGRLKQYLDRVLQEVASFEHRERAARERLYGSHQ
jgi:multimeric flavodoxin WrbA